MTLDEWLTAAKKSKSMTEEKFAALLGISQPQVNRLRKGKSWPSKDLMAAIRRHTDEMVTPNDWVPQSDEAAA